MKQIIQVLVTVVLEAMFSITYAQQDPQFTQYFDNTLFVNPA